MSEPGHQRRDKLWRNVSEMKNGLSKLGFPNESRSPIIPVIIGDEEAAVKLSGKLLEAGIFVPAIRYPTVPKGKARLRVTVSAAHTREHLDRALAAFSKVGKKLGRLHALSRGGDEEEDEAPSAGSGSDSAEAFAFERHCDVAADHRAWKRPTQAAQRRLQP